MSRNPYDDNPYEPSRDAEPPVRAELAERPATTRQRIMRDFISSLLILLLFFLAAGVAWLVHPPTGLIVGAVALVAFVLDILIFLKRLYPD